MPERPHQQWAQPCACPSCVPLACMASPTLARALEAHPRTQGQLCPQTHEAWALCPHLLSSHHSPSEKEVCHLWGELQTWLGAKTWEVKTRGAGGGLCLGDARLL